MRSTWVAFLCLAACRDGSPPNEQPARRPAEDAPRERVFTPSPAKVRSVGPYAISSNGVGLYALGTEMRNVLAILPSTAPVDLLDIEGIVKYKVVPPDEERILVGFDSTGLAAFIAVVAPDIALVEGGFGVGSEIDEVVMGLGPEVVDRAVRDPHLLVLSKLPNARIVTDGQRIIAIAVTREARKSVSEPLAAQVTGSACDRAAEILAGSLPEPHSEEDAARASYGCFTGALPEIALAEGDELVVYGGEPGRLRRITAVSAPGLLFAGALDVDRDGKSEIISVSERRSSDALAVRIVVWRGEGGGRLTEVADKEVYRMTSGSAGWVGAKLKDVSFLLEVLPGSTSSVEVRGLYFQRGEDRVRTVAPLLPETLAVRPRRVASPAGTVTEAPGAPPAAAKGGEGGGGKEGAAGKGKEGAAGKEKEAGKGEDGATRGKEGSAKGKGSGDGKPTPAPKAGSAAGGAKRDASDM